MVLHLFNTFFWSFFFAIGYISIYRRIEEGTIRWYRSKQVMLRFGELALVVYASSVEISLRILHHFLTTNLWTMVNLQTVVALYTCLTLRNKGANLLFLLVTLATFGSYGTLTWGLWLALIGLLIILFVVNLQSAWLVGNLSRYLAFVLPFGTFTWLLFKAFYAFSWQSLLVQLFCYVCVETIVFQYSILLKNRGAASAKLIYETMHDRLTGVPNWAKFNQDFQLYHELMLSTQINEIVLVAIDIDHFKQINDTYGHLAGNAVLTSFAHNLQTYIHQVNSEWEVYRAGGEEFNVIMAGIDQAAAKQVVEAYRQQLHELHVMYEGNKINVTASVGMTKLQGNDVQAEDTIKRAGQYLYQAKQAGRDAVIAGY
ncbi:GGDEF domain-containing protein [Loigolactobacillus coryniformis]|uniref:GGDEF domain-containing protein n=1 Tax=Loigolactobacillus coryniformis TaxID=1610 RepID=A0A5B8THP5_9LACO|nr:GGDEF domain-containing protein [Loigolactobacillus coryniformis]QEA51949.1 GGDEF domain-containing protein [Loigolactobacillus coryniformis]